MTACHTEQQTGEAEEQTASLTTTELKEVVFWDRSMAFLTLIHVLLQKKKQNEGCYLLASYIACNYGKKLNKEALPWPIFPVDTGCQHVAFLPNVRRP